MPEFLCHRPVFGEVSIVQTQVGWQLTNGHIHIELSRSSGGVRMKSLREEGGTEWAVAGTPLVAFPEKDKEYRYSADEVSDLAKGGKQLTLRFQSESGGMLSLMLRLYPSGAVVESAIQIENRGQRNLLLDAHIDPLFLAVQSPSAGLQPYSSKEGEHGFKAAGTLSADRKFDDWLVLENEAVKSVRSVVNPDSSSRMEATTHTSLPVRWCVQEYSYQG